MALFPASILNSVSIGSGDPILNPKTCTPKGIELRGSSSGFSTGSRQSVITQLMRGDGSFVPIGFQFDCEFWLDAAQFVVWDIFADQVGYGEVAKKFDIPIPLFWQPNFPEVAVNRFMDKFKVGNTPMMWRLATVPSFPADPISNRDRGYYAVSVTIEADLPF